jgi:hypothetical protein
VLGRPEVLGEPALGIDAGELDLPTAVQEQASSRARAVVCVGVGETLGMDENRQREVGAQLDGLSKSRTSACSAARSGGKTGCSAASTVPW